MSFSLSSSIQSYTIPLLTIQVAKRFAFIGQRPEVGSIDLERVLYRYYGLPTAALYGLYALLITSLRQRRSATSVAKPININSTASGSGTETTGAPPPTI